MQAVSLGFGKVNYETQSANLAAFVVSDPFVREFPQKVLKRQGHMQRFPASAYPDTHGCLYLDTYQVADGVVVCLQAQHRYRGAGLRDGALFLHIRDGGPMLVVRAALPSDPVALQTGDFLVFQGRADVLTLDELADYGIAPNERWIAAFMDEEEVNECFAVQVLSNAVAAKPHVERLEDAEGHVVTVKKRPGRKLRIR